MMLATSRAAVQQVRAALPSLYGFTLHIDRLHSGGGMYQP